MHKTPFHFHFPNKPAIRLHLNYNHRIKMVSFNFQSILLRRPSYIFWRWGMGRSLIHPWNGNWLPSTFAFSEFFLPAQIRLVGFTVHNFWIMCKVVSSILYVLWWEYKLGFIKLVNSFFPFWSISLIMHDSYFSPFSLFHQLIQDNSEFNISLWLGPVGFDHSISTNKNSKHAVLSWL